MKRRAQKKPERMVITSLKMSSGRVVTDPLEIVRLLRADGFDVDDSSGKITVGPRLRPQ